MFEEKEVNLFPKSLTGTTIQDSGTRERRDVVNTFFFYIILNLKSVAMDNYS